jgi:hypothetical protein
MMRAGPGSRESRELLMAVDDVSGCCRVVPASEVHAVVLSAGPDDPQIGLKNARDVESTIYPSRLKRNATRVARTRGWAGRSRRGRY